MATKGKRPMRALTAGDKIEAIQRVNDGESKASVARDIGVPESTLRGWCKNEDKLRYMSSRRSSPDTDKSSDGEPQEKRARTESPPAPASPAGLDLTAPERPAELTARRPDPTRERRAADPGASVSMSAISPLSGLGHVPGLTPGLTPALTPGLAPGLAHSHLGLSFNDIATNLTLLAQLNPGLGALATAPPTRPLRSVRSPKPHNGALNLSDKHSRSHHAEPHTDRRPKVDSLGKDVDDALWYWLKTQQAMLDLTAQTPTHPMRLGKADRAPPKPVAPAPPINPHVDYNRNTWFWQYYKQFGGALPPPEDKIKPASRVPKDKVENILYSQLTKGKTYEEEPLSLAHREARHDDRLQGDAARVLEPAIDPAAAVEGRERGGEKRQDATKTQAKAKNVLDNLLYNNNNNEGERVAPEERTAESEWEATAAAALEHGDKFLSWLEGSGDPAVTRVHVHQLRALLTNLRARRPLPVRH